MGTQVQQVLEVDLFPRRPWLALYNVRLKPKAAFDVPEEELAPIQRLFPDEMMAAIFAKLGPYTLGRAACVCRQWRTYSENPRHWQAACGEVFATVVGDQLSSRKLVQPTFRGCWRRLFLATPHARFDGIYVSRNTYVRAGAAEFRAAAAVHLVTYYRYYRFFPDGSLLYRTSPLVIRQVAKSLGANRPDAAAAADVVPPDPTAPGARRAAAAAGAQPVYPGRFLVRSGRVFTVVVYPNSRSTEMRSRLALRSTVQGANNRLDVQAIFSFDRDLALAGHCPVRPDDDPGSAEGSRNDSRRGLSAFVFVPWADVATTALNLPAKDMDFFVT